MKKSKPKKENYKRYNLKRKGVPGRRMELSHTMEVEKDKIAGWWWGIPLNPTLWRQRQEDLCEFKNNLVYKS